MIRIQVDILPRGDICRKHSICEIEIALDKLDEETQDASYCITLHSTDIGAKKLYVLHNRRDGIYVLIKKVLDEYVNLN